MPATTQSDYQATRQPTPEEVNTAVGMGVINLIIDKGLFRPDEEEPTVIIWDENAAATIGEFVRTHPLLPEMR